MTVGVKNNCIYFRFYRPQAEQISVVGDFNGWNPKMTPMSREENGYWSARLNLKDGVYKFRYLANGGQWFTDYAAHGIECADSLVIVGNAGFGNRPGSDGLIRKVKKSSVKQ